MMFVNVAVEIHLAGGNPLSIEKISSILDEDQLLRRWEAAGGKSIHFSSELACWKAPRSCANGYAVIGEVACNGTSKLFVSRFDGTGLITDAVNQELNKDSWIMID